MKNERTTESNFTVITYSNMTNTLTLFRTFPHSPEIIFSKYSDPDGLARWWGPHGFTNIFHSFDFTE
jgi:uncharacterized protein YndB with AHSA1/START domain